MGPDSIARRIRAGRWVRVHSGVYLLIPGPLTTPIRLWGGLLYAGSGAVASHRTAAWLDGFGHEPVEIDITIPEPRRVWSPAGVRIHRSTALELQRHPSKTPERTRVEDTVLDLVDCADSVDDLVAVVTWACRDRRTTPERVGRAAGMRKKLRWRGELAAVLDDVAAGAHAVLERTYLVSVERAHGLLCGTRQDRVRRRDRNEYRDVRYRGYGVIVELDGIIGHSTDADRRRDMHRDNMDILAGQLVLRFGWPDVSRRPCSVAAQVWLALRQRGWDGMPHRCGRSCEFPVS